MLDNSSPLREFLILGGCHAEATAVEDGTINTFESRLHDSDESVVLLTSEAEVHPVRRYPVR